MMEIVDGRYPQQQRQWSPMPMQWRDQPPHQAMQQQQQQQQQQSLSPRENQPARQQMPPSQHNQQPHTTDVHSPAINHAHPTPAPLQHQPQHTDAPSYPPPQQAAPRVDTAVLQFALQKQMFLNQSLLAQQNQLRMEMGMPPRIPGDGQSASPSPDCGYQPSPFDRTPEPAFGHSHHQQQMHQQQHPYQPTAGLRHGSVSPTNGGGLSIGTLPMTRAPSLDAAMGMASPTPQPLPTMPTRVKLEAIVHSPADAAMGNAGADDAASDSDDAGEDGGGSSSSASSHSVADHDEVNSEASESESDSGSSSEGEEDEDEVPPPKRQSTGGSKEEPRSTPVQTKKKSRSANSVTKPTTVVPKEVKEKAATEGAPTGMVVLNANGKPKRLKGSSCHQCKTRRTNLDLCHCGQAHVKKPTGARARKRKKERFCRKKYCARCLDKFYGEEAPAKLLPGEVNTWACPGCRGLCTCAACKRGLQKKEVQEAAAAAQEAHQAKLKEAKEKKEGAPSSPAAPATKEKERTGKEKPTKMLPVDAPVLASKASSSSSTKKKSTSTTTSSRSASGKKEGGKKDKDLASSPTANSRSRKKKVATLSSSSAGSSSAQSSAKSTPTITSKSSRGSAIKTVNQSPLSLTRSSGTSSRGKRSPKGNPRDTSAGAGHSSNASTSTSAISFGSHFGHLGAEDDMMRSPEDGGSTLTSASVSVSEEGDFTGTSVSEESAHHHQQQHQQQHYPSPHPMEIEFTEFPPPSREFASLHSPHVGSQMMRSPALQPQYQKLPPGASSLLSPATQYESIFQSTVSPSHSYGQLTSQPNSPWQTATGRKATHSRHSSLTMPPSAMELPELL